MAWQFHRPDTGEGLIQVFRREESRIEVAPFPLRGLDPEATYTLHDFDSGTDRRYTGRALTAGWRVEVPARRTAVLIRYRT
jgi:alpha-galactosidase